MAERIDITLAAKDKASSVINGVLGNITKLGQASIAGIGGLTAAAGAGAAALFDLADSAKGYNDLATSYAALTERMGVNTDEFTAALRDASSGMIDMRTLMESVNTSAQLVGTDFAKRLPDALGLLSKVAQSTGQDLDFLMQSLVTGVGRGSAMILDNLGVTVNVTEAYENWAEANGALVSEMTKTQQQTALLDQVIAKLIENTGHLPDAADQGTIQLARFQTQLIDLKTQIGAAVLPIVGKLAEAVGKKLEVAASIGIEIIGKLTEFLENLDFAITELDAKPLDAIAIAAQKAFPPDVASRVLQIVTGVKQFASASKVLANNIAEAVKPLIEFVSNNVKLKDALIAIGIAIGIALAPVIATVGQVVLTLVGLVAAVAVVRTAIENNSTGIGKAFNTIKEKIQQLATDAQPLIDQFVAEFNKVKVKISEIIAVAGPAIEGFIADFRTELETLKPDLLAAKDAISAAFESIKPALDTLKGALENVMGAIGDGFNDLTGGGESAGAAIISGVVGAIRLAINVFTAIVPHIANVISLVLNMRSAMLNSSANGITNGIVPAIQSLAAWISGTLVPAIRDDIIPALQQFGAWITGTVIPAVVNLATNIGQFLTNALNTLKTAWQTVINAVQFVIGVFTTVLGAIMSVAAFIDGTVLELIRTLARLFVAVLGVALAAAANVFRNVLLPAIQAVGDFVKGAFTTAMDGIKAFLQGPVASAVQTLSEKLEPLRSAFSKVADTVSGALTTAFENIKSFMQGPLNEAAESVSDVLNDTLGKAIDAVKGGFDAAARGVSAFKTAIDGLITKVNNLINRLNDLAGAMGGTGLLAQSPPPIVTGMKMTKQASRQLISGGINPLANATENLGGTSGAQAFQGLAGPAGFGNGQQGGGMAINIQSLQIVVDSDQVAEQVLNEFNTLSVQYGRG